VATYLFHYNDPLTFSLELLSSDNNVSIKNLSNNSSDKVWDLIEKSMLSMNRYWIDFDPKFENLAIIIKLELQHNQFTINTIFKSNTSNIE
jgi:predicted P-loop ATPase